jgi:hypothetical protein
MVQQDDIIEVETDSTFINANTVPALLEEVQQQHIIPVFARDNETLISHGDFIEAVQEISTRVFSGETILRPRIRLSHPIKGRIPEAKDKPANDLMEHEKTMYYERMAFVLEIPSITETVDDNPLSLMVGGVKSYGMDNLYSKKGGDEHFKVFVGFQNRVCTNLCIWSDGYVGDLKVKNLGMLKASIKTLLESYNQNLHLFHLKQLSRYTLTEHQFATLLGRCRMYPHLPGIQKEGVPPLLFGESQIGAICKDYYRDKSFCRDQDGNINLWKLYNLFTGVNKSTYIDQFTERSVNAFEFVEQLRWALDGNRENWYLN